MKGFFYGQTEYNMFDNTNRIDSYVKFAKENSFDFLTITDSNLYGNYKFYNLCVKNHIKPIVGLEYSFITEDQNYSKVLLYAKNNNGYQKLLRISSEVKINSVDSLEYILNDCDDLILIFVFNDSFFERMFLSREYSLLDEYIMLISSKKSAYFGVSFTNKIDKHDLNKSFQEYVLNRIKCVPIHQCKYLNNNDSIIYEALTQIGGKNVKLSSFEDYSFDANPICDDTIDEIVNSISLNLFTEHIALPKYPKTKNVSSKEYLKALCYKGLEKRKKYNEQYIERLNYELSIINKMNYDDYFLIVWDFIKYAKQNDILVGPGRGSAAGSLVAYCLGITEVDPLKYDLLFERFLNPERISMPDIDTDFPDIDRDKVIEHVKDLYGKDHVCNISAYGTFLVKSSIRDLARVYKMDNSRVERIIEMVEKYGFERLLEEYKDNELYDFLYIANGLVGLPRHISTHAAGIILSNCPLTNIIPLQEGIGGLYQSQLEASDLEKIGLLKMDFLGIRNLTMIHSMMKDIPNFTVDRLRGISLEDPKVYRLLQNADTLGIFQLESIGIRNVLKKLKPTCFDDLVAVLALYRPGPMDNIDEYINRKHGKKFTYIHESLRPILSSTYGIIIYQEQIMKIAQAFAGYSLGEADVLRRAVSKKDAELLREKEADFVKKSIEKGYSELVAKQIYDLIYKFANYGFNKSHSVAYAILSYQMAYIKAYYFDVFMTNILNNVISSKDTLLSYIKYAKLNGLETVKPNINISRGKFVFVDGKLYLPFTAILSIGDTVSDAIVNERDLNGDFKDFNDFKARVKNINSQNIEALIFSGAFDLFGKTKKNLCKNITAEDQLYLRHMHNIIDFKDDYDFSYLKNQEFKYLGMNIEYNKFRDIDALSKKYKTISLNKCTYNTQSRLLVCFEDIKEIKTKKNEPMLVGTMVDEAASKKFVIFPRIYEKLTEKLEKNIIYLVLGVLEKDQKGEDSISILKIARINENNNTN